MTTTQPTPTRLEATMTTTTETPELVSNCKDIWGHSDCSGYVMGVYYRCGLAASA